MLALPHAVQAAHICLRSPLLIIRLFVHMTDYAAIWGYFTLKPDFTRSRNGVVVHHHSSIKNFNSHPIFHRTHLRQPHHHMLSHHTFTTHHLHPTPSYNPLKTPVNHYIFTENYYKTVFIGAKTSNFLSFSFWIPFDIPLSLCYNNFASK